MLFWNPNSEKWKILSRLCLVPMLCLATMACTQEHESAGSQRVLIPWPDGNGSYSLQEVELQTLRNLKEVRGDAADIYVDPKEDGQQIMGPRPAADFVLTDSGLIVPRNYLSSQFFGLYAHAEKLWDLDRLSGADQLISRPRKYGFGLRERAGEMTINNAFYLGKFDAIMILPFDGSKNENHQQLPMALNAGIMGHEHFHSLFESVLKGQESALHAEEQSDVMPRQFRQKEESPAEWNAFLLSALNEGLADVWGWIYSGDTAFLSHSLPTSNSQRRLDTLTSGPVRTAADFKQERMRPDGSYSPQSVYELATYFARRIRAESVSNGSGSLEARQELAKHIVTQLKQLAASKIIDLKQTEAEIEIESVVQMFILPKKEVQP